jgi:ribosomal protein S18 acetylase RimI-like enzyme
MRFVQVKKEDLPDFYSFYSMWRFNPNKKKYRSFIKSLTNKHQLYFCYDLLIIVGVLVIETKPLCNEIIGIGVLDNHRSQGVGKGLINFAIASNAYENLFAETDDEAVGFYIKNNFKINKISSIDNVSRYECERIIT